MKKFCFFVLVFFITASIYCQQNDRFCLLTRLQPEFSFYKNNYAYRNKDTYTKSSVNCGVEIAVQYNISKRFFAETGLGYISRKLNTVAFLNQNLLPSPRQSPTFELVNTKSVSLRMLQLPIRLGYSFVEKQKISLNFCVGLAGNFLLNTCYKNSEFTKYDDTYRKGYWQGFSVLSGVGTAYKVNKKISLTGHIEYSLLNKVVNDNYLFSQDKAPISLPHTYLQIAIGTKLDI